MDLATQSNLNMKKISGYVNQKGLIKANILLNTKQPDSTSIITKPSKYEFPSIGTQEVLYVATEENKIYRWDDLELKYFVVGTNYEEIQIINGGNANE